MHMHRRHSASQTITVTTTTKNGKNPSKKNKNKKKNMTKKKNIKKTMKNVKSSIIPGFLFHTKNPRQFLGFVVAVAKFFSTKSSTISMLFHFRFVFFPRKTNHHQVGREKSTNLLMEMDKNR